MPEDIGMKSLVAVIALILVHAGQAFAAQGQCQAGLCVMFEVSVALESQLGPSVTVNKSEVAMINGVSNSYSTRVIAAEDRCTKQVLVEESYFRAMKAVMDSVVDANGGAEATLTPSQQTMLIFYSTLMQQTLGFTCTARDLSPRTAVDHEDRGGVNNDVSRDGRAGTLIGVASAVGQPAVVIVAEADGVQELSVGDRLADGSKIVSIASSTSNMVIERDGKLITIRVGESY
jgi:hypothetical protein